MSASDGDNWRLCADVQAPTPARATLHELVGATRKHDLLSGVQARAESVAPHQVAITHDGDSLFAYAADVAVLATARRAVEGVVSQAGLSAAFTVSRWDADVARWEQTDPPPTADQARAERATRREDATPETRTLIASAGRLIRREFEQSLVEYAQQLGVECEIAEHPHLLTTQVAFTIKGPRRKLDEFASGLEQEERQTIRNEQTLVLGPL